MGGGKKPSTPPPSPYEQQGAQIAKETYEETTPLRKEFLQQMGQFTQGGYDPTKMAIFSPLYDIARAGPEAQYRGAMENILAGTPRGGGQTAAIAQTELARAKDVGSIPGMITSDLLTDMLNKAYGAAFNAPQTSMAGFGSLASTYAGRQVGLTQAAGQQKGAAFSALGGLGMGAGMAAGGKKPPVKA